MTRDATDAWNRGEANALSVSLTGPESHRLLYEPGRGDLRIAPPGLCHDVADLPVESGVAVDWSALADLRTTSGYRWPRFLYYVGDDPSLFSWARGLQPGLEDLSWTPTASAKIDASDANISTLTVNLTRRVPVELHVPRSCTHLTLRGDISLATVRTKAVDPDMQLTLAPRTSPSVEADPLAIPPLPGLGALRHLGITNAPLRQAIDITSISTITTLKGLAVSGSVTGLEAIADLTSLESLAFRYVADLQGMPPLASLPALSSLIAWNVEESAGKRLRTECRALEMPKLGDGEGYSVSQLRRPDWFFENHRLPFSAWTSKSARAATRAFRRAEKQIATIEHDDAAVDVLAAFGRAIAELRGLETTEREDAREAFALLAAAAGCDLDRATIDDVFGRHCDF